MGQEPATTIDRREVLPGDPGVLRDMFSKMLLIRRFEEKAAEMYAMQKIGGFCHLYIGQEAVGVGALSRLRSDDYVLTSYRDHGIGLALGCEPRRLMAELFGKATGISLGKGGSMHMFDAERRFLGGHAIVGGHLPLATGVAWAIKYQEHDQVVLCFFGEAAVNIGAFHESLNLAALWKLPVVYICENNRYGMGTAIERASAIYDVAQRACAYDMSNETVDGMDVLAMREAVGRAVELARNESLPTLIEARCYRFMGHSMSDPVHGHYRTKEEVEEQKAHDPIRTYFERLRGGGVITDDQFQAMDQEIRRIVEDAVQFAEESPVPPPDAIYRDVYANPYGPYK